MILLSLTFGFREVFVEDKNLGECRAEARTSKSLLNVPNEVRAQRGRSKIFDFTEKLLYLGVHGCN